MKTQKTLNEVRKWEKFTYRGRQIKMIVDKQENRGNILC